MKSEKSRRGPTGRAPISKAIAKNIGSFNLYSEVLVKLILQHHHHIPEASKALGYIRSRNWDLLYKWAESIAEVTYDGAAQHYAANQLTALIKKYPWGDKIPSFDPDRAAREKFVNAEKQCKVSNNRFSRSRNLMRSRFYPLLQDMRRWIKYVIGVEPDMDKIYANCGHGTGATVGVHGNATGLHRKLLDASPTCTETALPYAIEAMWRNPHISEFLLREEQGYDRQFYCADRDELARIVRRKVRITDCNKLSFVPKTAKTKRSIAVEPTLNTYVQRGIDTVLRVKLEKVGRFLNYQGHNQELARVGSIDGSYATIDLSSASDTVSKGLVNYLLPPSWFALLSKVRSPSFQDKILGSEAGVGNYEKLSSMGNNFTFPLETLIFAAAARASMRATGCWGAESWSVYGDDIIVPTTAARVLIPLLKFLGFTPNPDKCFIDSSGKFRESCGSDWHTGQDVRPVELDYPLSGTSERMIFHNACLRSERSREFFAEILPLIRDSVSYAERLVRPIWGQRKYEYCADLLTQRNLNGAFSVPLDVFMSDKRARWSRSLQTWRWEEFHFQTVEDDEINAAASSRRGEHLAYIALLSGQPGGRATLRYTTKRRLKVI